MRVDYAIGIPQIFYAFLISFIILSVVFLGNVYELATVDIQ